MYEDLIVPAGGSLPATTSPSANPAPAGGNVESFVQTYLPLAQKVSEKTGVAPESLLGQWGLETGWGKSVIPGTNNLGNIKDVTRKGPVAVDNMTKSSDSYMAFETPDQFGDHYVGLLGRRYKTAMGAGDDSQKFFTELKRSGYAEDPGYIQKGVNAANMVAKVLGGEGRQMTTVRDPQAAAPAPGGEYFMPQRGVYADLIVPPEPRSFGEAAADTALGAASGVVQGVGLLANVAGADNPVSRGASEISQSLMGMQSPQRQAERAARADTIRAAEETGSTWEEIKANVGGFLEAPVETTLNALGTSAPTILTAFIPGLGQAGAARLILQGALGAAQGAGAVKGSIYESVERKLVESGLSKDEAAKIAAGAQAYDSENGGNIAAGAILGAAAGTTGIEAMLSKAMGGNAAARGLLARAGIGVATEAPVEGAQGGQERYASNVALQNEGFDVPTFQGVAGQAAGEAVASAPGGAAFGALTPPGPVPAPIPPELQPVADKAAEPNSPLSKAAMAGVQTGAAQAALQPAAPQVDPMQRLAELEAIGKDKPAQQVTDEAGNPLTAPGERGRFFTAEEKAEYDQLKALRDSTPGMTPEDRDQVQQAEVSQRDEILERVTEIRELLRVPGALDSLRAEGAPTTVQKFLGDLATAASKSASPAVREQALNRAEMAAEVAGLQLQRRDDMPRSQTNERTGPPTRADQAAGMVTSTAGISADERVEALQAIAAYRNPNLPAGTRQAALNRALEIVGRAQAPRGTPSDRQTPAVLDEIPPQPNTPEWFEAEAKRREEGAWQFRQLGYDDEADALLAEIDPLLEAAASARAGELGMEDSAAEGDGIASPVAQQTVDQATAGLPRAPIAPEDVSRPAEERTTARRKRRGQFRQLADLGFETVERDGDGFVLRNAKTGQAVTLESAADAQLARMAIKDAVDAKAHTAAASPLNDRKEPTEGQIRAGNYKKSDVIEMNGVKVVIENPRGSVRRGVGADGKPWETEMKHHYGEIVGTEGADGDRVDVFIGSRPDSNRIFIVDQVNEDGSFDEHKVVFGATSEADARKTYLDNYEKGWTGLGSIKEMAQPDFVQWVKSRAAKKPASESEIGTFTVTSDGKTYTLRSVAVDGMPAAADSAARGERGQRITKNQALLLKGLAGFFGKDVVFFSDPENKVNADGFIKPGDNVTLYINERSGISPLAVFGHELMHLLKLDNPVAYAAIEKVVRDRVADPKGFRADYEGKKRDDAKDGDLSSAELEELISDLNGNLMGDAAFWKSVFDEIQGAAGKEAKGIIAQLQAFLQRMLDGAVAAFKGQPTFKADGFIKDADAVRAAFRTGLAQWAQSQGITKAAMQGELLRAEKKLGDVKKSTPRPTDGLTVTGYHFSKQPRTLLTTGFFGTGLQGSDREQIMAHPDRRLRERLSFYANKGTGVRPESGVGGIAHKAELTNIYDSDADMKRLKEGRDRRGFESAVINVGYSGYLSRLEGSQPAQVILLGRQTVTPEVLGPRNQIDDAPLVPAKQQRPMNLGDKILANKALPAGKMPPQTWAKILMATMPEEAAQLLDVGALGTKDVYKDELVRMIREASGDIKKSAARAKSEFAEVEAKYKDTDQWLKAPNGAKTNLNQRQWVQVRTPAFKKWFGDWEAAAAKGGVWASNDVSKAVDENGEPLVVYHGTDKGGFSEFKEPGGTKRGDLGIFTTPNRWMASSYVRKGRAGAITEDKLQPQDAEIKDLGFSLPNGNRWVLSLDGGKRQSYYETEEAAQDALESMGGEKTSGVYALFLNIRDPNESDFEGALWSGERPDQYQVRNEDGENIEWDGRIYFDLETAQRLADENEGAEVEPADDRFETTDDVVKDARRYDNDGAIIRNVIDDGGGGGGYDLEPSDVFVALDPSQLKSADFNGGEFSADSDDIRKSEKREYKLDIERESRVKSKAVRMLPEELAAIDADAKKLGLSTVQVKSIIDSAKATKRQYPASEGWAPISVVGVNVKKDDDGNQIAGTEEPKFKEISYGFNVTPGKTRASPKMDTELAGKVAKKFEQLILEIYDRAQSGDKNAQIIVGHQTWYRNVAEVLRREYGATGDMLADLLGATSPNTPVDTNWKFSIDIMRRFVRGDFDEQLEKFSQFVERGGDPSKYPAADKIRQISGKLYGMNSTNAMKALVDMWRVIEPGQAPKARNFALNLIGQSNMATIDVWAARMLRRAANMVRGVKLPRIPPAAETGVTGNWNADGTKVTGEFGFGAEVMQMVSDSLDKRGIKVSPPDLQAIAWFAEKELWGQKGWTTKTGEGGSFEENIEATPVERYLAGWSIQQGEKRPDEGESSMAQARVMSMLVGDDTVLAARVLPTYGLYGGTIEASFDTEWTAQKGKHDPTMVMAEIAKLAQENNQWDIFVSRVVQPGEDNPNARPGVEIYFRDRKSLDQAMPVLERFTSRGQDGFTMAVDPRAKRKGLDDQEFIGVRLQYVPEISMRWDDTLRDEILKPGAADKILGEKRQLLHEIAREVRSMDGVAFAAMQQYDTVVVGKESYDEYIDRATEEGRQGARAQAWFGRPVRQGLEGAAARLRGERRQVDRGGLQDAGDAVQADPAGRADARAILDAGGVRRSPSRVDASGRKDQGSGREEDGSLKGLPRDFKVAGIDIRASHWAPAEAVARKYMEGAGLEYRPPTQYAKVDKERAARIAAEYDRMKHDPQNPMVKAAYKALAKETIAQYKAVIDSGLEVEFIDFAVQGDPYAASPRLATEDVRNNNHMWVFSTRDGFGSNADFDPEDNPLLAETEFMISGQRALVNDLFRVVHDYFGHVKEGVGFRADGEENTWRAHSSMFSPLAQRALTTETRGQNSWVNYGPHGEKNRTASAGDTIFADQKTGLLPLWVSEEGRYDDITKSPTRADDDEITVTIGDEAPAAPQATASKDEVTAQEAKGKSVTYDVEVEDTGETAKMTVDAGQALSDYDERIDTMKKLLECLKK